VARRLGLCHAGTGVLLQLIVAPLLTHDLARVQAVHPSVQEGDVLVADRGLCS
jgi:Transposase DDE domain